MKIAHQWWFRSAILGGVVATLSFGLQACGKDEDTSRGTPRASMNLDIGREYTLVGEMLLEEKDFPGVPAGATLTRLTARPTAAYTEERPEVALQLFFRGQPAREIVSREWGFPKRSEILNILNRCTEYQGKLHEKYFVPGLGEFRSCQLETVDEETHSKIQAWYGEVPGGVLRVELRKADGTLRGQMTLQSFTW